MMKSKPRARLINLFYPNGFCNKIYCARSTAKCTGTIFLIESSDFMRRNSIIKQISESQFSKTALSVILGIVIVTLCLLGFSFLLTLTDGNDAVKSVMATLSMCAGCFVAGFFCGKNKREKGIINGIICGFCVYAAIFFAGTLILKITAEAGVLGKVLLCCVISAIGAVLGVNSKQNFKALRPKKNRFGS